jgi:hypothetical protein
LLKLLVEYSMEKFLLLPAGLSEEFLRIGTGDTQAERMQEALMKSNILQSGERLLGISDVTPWHRGGAETYVADSIIELQSKHEERRHVIAKALVSFGSRPEAQLASWVKRRTLIAELGIRVPYMYSASRGAIYEEFIESELEPTSFTVPKLLEEMAKIAATLDHSGFATIAFLSDLRRRADKLYYIDFGSDLGEPGQVATSCARGLLERKLPEPYKAECLMHYAAVFSDLSTADRGKSSSS